MNSAPLNSRPLKSIAIDPQDDSQARLQRLAGTAERLLARCKAQGATQAEVSCTEDSGLAVNVRMGEVEAPKPSVSCCTAATTPSSSRPAESMLCVAPSVSAVASFFWSRSIAMMTDAPASRAPTIAALPTPPHPITATESPRVTLPVFRAAPIPAMMPQPSSPTTAGSAAGSTLVHCFSCTRVFSANAPIPRAGLSTVPSVRVIFCVALKVLKQYHGSARLQARQSPQTARQFSTTKSPTATWVTPSPTTLTRPAASWPSRNGNSLLMPPSR